MRNDLHPLQEHKVRLTLAFLIKLATPNIDDFFYGGTVCATELPRLCLFFLPNKLRLPRDSPLTSEKAAVEDAATLLAALLVAATLSSSVLFLFI
jgi:hypothetical protein